MFMFSNYTELLKEESFHLVKKIEELEKRLAKYEERYLSLEEACRLLNKSRATVSRYINAGILSARKIQPNIKQSPMEIAYSAIVRFRNGQ